MTAQRNTMWQCAVRARLRVEDIAVELRCPVEDVRREVEILRAEGQIAVMFALPDRVTEG